MAKRKSLTYKRYEGSSSSTASKAEVRSGGEDLATSVNDRLYELRQAEPSEAAERRRALADSVNQASVPPEVQRILGVRSTAQPLPPRLRARGRERTRTPGPVPPSSWLQGDVSGTASSTSDAPAKKSSHTAYERPWINLHRFRTLYTGTTQSQSLTGLALSKLARAWDALEPTDKELTTALPSRVRIELLSFLAHFQQTVTATDFHLLTGDAGSISELDLGGLAGRADLSLAFLIHFLKQTHQPHDDQDIAETWESVSLQPLSLQPSSTFHSLSHLCLSHPPKTVLWRDLLSLSKHTPSLTHLSLAYWPKPTLTPNLSTAFVTNSTGHVVDAGGSNFYSEADLDIEETVVIFRQLSAKLLSLQFLDIEGNHSWLPALAYGSVAAGFSEVLTGNWRGLTRIFCDSIPAEHVEKFINSQRLPQSNLLGFDNRSRRQFILASKIQSSGGRIVLRDSYESWELTILAMRCIALCRHEARAPRLVFDPGQFTD